MGGRKWTTASRLRQALAHGTQYGTKYETASIAGQREKRFEQMGFFLLRKTVFMKGGHRV